MKSKTQKKLNPKIPPLKQKPIFQREALQQKTKMHVFHGLDSSLKVPIKKTAYELIAQSELRSCCALWSKKSLLDNSAHTFFRTADHNLTVFTLNPL